MFEALIQELQAVKGESIPGRGTSTSRERTVLGKPYWDRKGFTEELVG